MIKDYKKICYIALLFAGMGENYIKAGIFGGMSKSDCEKFLHSSSIQLTRYEQKALDGIIKKMDQEFSFIFCVSQAPTASVVEQTALKELQKYDGLMARYKNNYSEQTIKDKLKEKGFTQEKIDYLKKVLGEFKKKSIPPMYFQIQTHMLNLKEAITFFIKQIYKSIPFYKTEPTIFTEESALKDLSDSTTRMESILEDLYGKKMGPEAIPNDKRIFYLQIIKDNVLPGFYTEVKESNEPREQRYAIRILQLYIEKFYAGLFSAEGFKKIISAK
ncbi:MAG: hypothetical protein UU47_C0013G0015 [candidate division TM6 bacterium GW2011_GWE2_41_16]|nr:MAG: hypothetical protein UU47_C0013G0015 [candidate division TM6 bacterium GW2011_GWE2_41_16]